MSWFAKARELVVKFGPTVGTGGAAQIAFSKPIRVGTRVRFNDYGVLRITLGAGSWSSEFDSISGQVRDKTGTNCGGAG